MQSRRGKALDLYDRCIARGLPHGDLPDDLQQHVAHRAGPGFVAIRHEMIHDTRVIPINGGPHLWDAAPHLRHSTQPDVFEYGCHEGNYAMRNILSGARAAEKAAATGSNGR